MNTKKKYTYTYDRICEVCQKPFQTQRYATKLCSEECVRGKLSQKRKYTDEQVDKAVALKLQGYSSKEIEKETGIKKPSQDKIFSEKNIKLNEEQKQVLLRNRWKNHEPVVDGKKQCSKCKIFKPLDSFHKNNNRITGAVSACKDCYAIYYGENKEIIIDRVSNYRKRNPEKKKERSRIYYENNIEKRISNAKLWANNNPEKRRNIEKRYNESHPGEKVARTAAYRARKRQAMPSWLNSAQKQEIANMYENCPNDFHVDHIVPLAGEEVCGLHVPWNLQYLLGYQNESKGNKFYNENSDTPECHQYKRKIDTLQEDIDNGMPINPELSRFSLSYEKFTEEHKKFIERYEWLGTVGYSPKWVFTARIDKILGGVVILSEPNGYTKDKKIEALISRGATASWTPKNLGSKMIMFSCNWMVKNTDKRIFFGYSDHEAGEIGTIYQACNFLYLGRHFGAKISYLLNNRVVTGRYFTKTSTFKKYAAELGIPWQKEWEKPNKYMAIGKIPQNILLSLKEKGVMERNSCIKKNIAPKSKYVLFMGRTKKEKKNLHSIYASVFNGYLPYPKRHL